jgi:hypothetical protein
MNKYLLILLTVFYVANLFAQDHNTNISLVINRQTFRFQITDITPDQGTLTISRNSKINKKDTMYTDGLSNLKFSDFDKDLLLH